MLQNALFPRQLQAYFCNLRWCPFKINFSSVRNKTTTRFNTDTYLSATPEKCCIYIRTLICILEFVPESGPYRLGRTLDTHVVFV